MSILIHSRNPVHRVLLLILGSGLLWLLALLDGSLGLIFLGSLVWCLHIRLQESMFLHDRMIDKFGEIFEHLAGRED